MNQNQPKGTIKRGRGRPKGVPNRKKGTGPSTQTKAIYNRAKAMKHLGFILENAARFCDSHEISLLLSKEKDITEKIHPNTIAKILKKHQMDVSSLRAKYLSAVNDVAISNERVRMERLERIYQRVSIGKSYSDMNLAIKCITEARNEIKGSSINLQFNQYNQFNQTTDDELMRRKKEIEKKIAILVDNQQTIDAETVKEDTREPAKV